MVDYLKYMVSQILIPYIVFWYYYCVNRVFCLVGWFLFVCLFAFIFVLCSFVLWRGEYVMIWTICSWRKTIIKLCTSGSLLILLSTQIRRSTNKIHFQGFIMPVYIGYSCFQSNQQLTKVFVTWFAPTTVFHR